MNDDAAKTAIDMADKLNESFQISIGWTIVLFLIGFILGHRMARKAALKKYLKRWREEEPDTED